MMKSICHYSLFFYRLIPFSFFCGMLPSPTFCVPSQFVSWSVRPLEPPSTSLIDELVRRGVDVSAVFDGTTLSFVHHVELDNNSLVIWKIGKSYVCHLFCQCFFVTLRCISSYSIWWYADIVEKISIRYYFAFSQEPRKLNWWKTDWIQQSVFGIKSTNNMWQVTRIVIPVVSKAMHTQ